MREPRPVELAVDDDGHPPAGDVVASQLEQAAGHRSPSGRAERAAGRGARPPTASSRRCREARSRSAPPPRRTLAGRRPRRARRPAQLAGDRGDAESGHAAGVDELEVGQVGGDVERDAVVGDALLDAQAERARACAGPSAPRRRPSSRDSRRAARPARRSSRAVSTMAASRARTNGRSSSPQSASRTMGYATSWPGPW